MLTLDSWLRHLENPLRRIFQLQLRVFYIAQCLFLSNLKKSKQNKVKQTTFIAVYLLDSSMITLDSWLRHLANPLRCIFQLQ